MIHFASDHNGSATEAGSLALHSVLDRVNNVYTYAKPLLNDQQSSRPNSSPCSDLSASAPPFTIRPLTASSADLNQCGSVATSPPHLSSTQIQPRAVCSTLFTPWLWQRTDSMPFLNSSTTQTAVGWFMGGGGLVYRTETELLVKWCPDNSL